MLGPSEAVFTGLMGCLLVNNVLNGLHGQSFKLLRWSPVSLRTLTAKSFYPHLISYLADVLPIQANV